MPTGPIDLSYLERFCQGDRARMVKYIDLYLAEAPAGFKELEQAATVLEAGPLAAAARSLRPMAQQMGALRLMEVLSEVEGLARSEGATACEALMEEALSLSAQVNSALRAARVALATG